MTKLFFCIICPNGCDMEAEIADGTIRNLEGNRCQKGWDYANQELSSPTRNIATSVQISGGDMPLCSVRLTKPIPKDRIFDVMGEIRKIRIPAPVAIGRVILSDVLGLGCDVVATRNVNCADRLSG